MVPALAQAGWYDANWSNRQKITILPTLADADLTNFPYLVKITDPTNPVFSNAQANGDDILFTGEATSRLTGVSVPEFLKALGTFDGTLGHVVMSRQHFLDRACRQAVARNVDDVVRAGHDHGHAEAPQSGPELQGGLEDHPFLQGAGDAHGAVGGAASTFMAMSASIFCTIWKLEMGAPNC